MPSGRKNTDSRFDKRLYRKNPMLMLWEELPQENDTIQYRLVLFDLQLQRKEILPGLKGHPGGNDETGGGRHTENGRVFGRGV